MGQFPPRCFLSIRGELSWFALLSFRIQKNILNQNWRNQLLASDLEYPRSLGRAYAGHLHSGAKAKKNECGLVNHPPLPPPNALQTQSVGKSQMRLYTISTDFCSNPLRSAPVLPEPLGAPLRPLLVALRLRAPKLLDPRLHPLRLWLRRSPRPQTHREKKRDPR